MRLVVFIHRPTGQQVVYDDERSWWCGPVGEHLPDPLEAAPVGLVDCIVLEARVDGLLGKYAWHEVARCACTPFSGMDDVPAQAYGQDLPA